MLVRTRMLYSGVGLDHLKETLFLIFSFSLIFAVLSVEEMWYYLLFVLNIRLRGPTEMLYLVVQKSISQNIQIGS